MGCRKNTAERMDDLLEYGAGTASADFRRSFEEHIQECAGCADAGQAQAAVSRMLDGWVVGEVSADFDRKLYARIEAEQSAPRLERWWAVAADWIRPLFAQPAIPLAAAMTVLVVGFAIDHKAEQAVGTAYSRPHVSRGTSLGPVRADQPVRVDQVEATLDDIDMLHQFEGGDSTNASKSM